MHRNLLLILLIFALLSCSKESNTEYPDRVVDQQKELVKLQIQDFDDTHVLRGMMPRDRVLLKQLRNLVEVTEKYYQNELTQDSLKSFVLATNLTVSNKELLLEGLPENRQSAFVFAARAAHLFRKQLESHYFHLDAVQPVAIRNKDSLQVFLIAASSAITPFIFLENNGKYQRAEPSFTDFPIATFNLNKVTYLKQDLEFSEGTKKEFGYYSLPITLERDTFLTIIEYKKHLPTTE
jgi:hypothetical protein